MAGSIRLGRATLTYEVEPPAVASEEIEGIALPAAGGAPARKIIGRSRALQALVEKLRRIAPTNDSVLLLGETGVGKDLLAQFLHTENPKRRSHPFIAVNCATIPPTLADSQLFGHVKGAFTGAVSDQAGFFQQAHRGTLFLDEIGELPLESQSRLLRVLEDGLVRPVGGSREGSVDVRVIFATNRNLEEAIDQKQFRQDLYERIDWTLRVPSLKDRREDIPALTHYFISQHAPAPLKIGAEVLNFLQTREWKGNIRALNRSVRRAITNALSRGAQDLQIEDFDLLDAPQSSPQSIAPLGALGCGPRASEIRRSKRESLEEILRDCQGNVSHAARELGVSRVTIHAWIKEDGIRLEPMRRG